MARGRMIHTRIWRSETLCSYGLRERLLWIGLVTNADDQGRGRAHPGLVRADIFPLEDVPLADIEQALRQFSADDMLILYQDGTKQLYQVANWWDYQGAMNWAWPSDYPPPAGWADRIKYRQGNDVIKDKWDENGGASDDVPGEAEPTTAPPRPHDEPTASSAPNGNGNNNINGNRTVTPTTAPPQTQSEPVQEPPSDVVDSLREELLDWQMLAPQAEQCVTQRAPHDIRRFLDYVEEHKGEMRNPAGFLYDALVKKPQPAPPPRAPPSANSKESRRAAYVVDGVTMPIEVEDGVPP